LQAIFHLHYALKEEGICPEGLKHRQDKYLNNRIERDYSKLEKLIKPGQ
jgi:hypothetical protein